VTHIYSPRIVLFVKKRCQVVIYPNQDPMYRKASHQIYRKYTIVQQSLYFTILENLFSDHLLSNRFLIVPFFKNILFYHIIIIIISKAINMLLFTLHSPHLTIIITCIITIINAINIICLSSE
jgi:hypothetical protein